MNYNIGTVHNSLACFFMLLSKHIFTATQRDLERHGSCRDLEALLVICLIASMYGPDFFILL